MNTEGLYGLAVAAYAGWTATAAAGIPSPDAEAFAERCVRRYARAADVDLEWAKLDVRHEAEHAMWLASLDKLDAASGG